MVRRESGHLEFVFFDNLNEMKSVLWLLDYNIGLSCFSKAYDECKNVEAIKHSIDAATSCVSGIDDACMIILGWAVSSAAFTVCL